MILEGPGTFFLELDPGDCQAIDFASMSARAPSFIKVEVDGELVESAYIGPYGSPHTWWNGNALLGRKQLLPGTQIKIELGPDVLLRIDGDVKRSS